MSYLNKIIIYGGCSEDNKVLSDLWIFDTDENELNEIKLGHGNGPGPRMSHASCIWHDTMYISGGFMDYGVIYDDIFKLDLNLMDQWSFVRHLNKKTFSHIMVSIDDLGIIIYGGCPDMMPNSLIVFNPISNIMRILKVIN